MYRRHVETRGQEKNGEYGCDLHGFQRLRSDAHLEAPPDIAATLVALKKGLEDESHNHVFETSKAMFSQRQRTELLKEAGSCFVGLRGRGGRRFGAYSMAVRPWTSASSSLSLLMPS